MESVNEDDDNRPAKQSDLSCCRACLATDDKLFNMHEYTLVGEFFRVTGIIVLETDKLPQHLCVWCAALMKRCAAFRAKCLRAEQCLQQLEGKLTTDSICNINRLANRLVDQNQTETEVVSIESSVIPVDLVPMPIAILTNPRSELCTVVKKELCMDIENINEIKNDTRNIKHESDFIYVEHHDICNDEIFGNISNKTLKSESTSEPAKKVKKDVSVKTRKRKAKTSTTEVKTKRQRKKKDPADTAEGKRSKKLKKTAKDKPKPNVNMEEFKKTCDVDIVILTHEEQVAEIEARRATDKYQAALYRCQPCGKHFRTEEVLQHHNTKHAPEAGPYECLVCAIRHRCKPTQMRHSDIHRLKFVCRQCGFVSRTRTQAKLHHLYHAGKKYPCEHCGREFSKRTTWLGHVRQTHKAMNVACDMCGETFVNNLGLKCHKVLTHGVATQKQSKTMECKICGVRFVSLGALEHHVLAAGPSEHEHAGTCTQCGGCFGTEDQLKEHVEAEHPSCKECNSTFLNAESYEVHVQRKHLGKGNGEYARRKEANRRARARGAPLPYPAPKPSGGKNTNKDVYKVCCELCGKIVSNSTNLVYHLRKHRGEKMPHACEQCPKSFYIKQQLEQHMRVHTGEKPFQCEQCDLAFTLKSNLERHVRVVHQGIRRTTECPICGRHLATPFTMKMHVRTVHNGEPWPKRAPREKRKKQCKALVDARGGACSGAGRAACMSNKGHSYWCPESTSTLHKVYGRSPAPLHAPRRAYAPFYGNSRQPYYFV